MTLCQKNCDVIVIFSIYGQFGAIRKPGSRRLVFYVAKTENRTKKSLKQLSNYWFE